MKPAAYLPAVKAGRISDGSDLNVDKEAITVEGSLADLANDITKDDQNFLRKGTQNTR